MSESAPTAASPTTLSCRRVLAALSSTPWFIQRDALDTIIAVAQRLNESPQDVAMRLGRPLEHTRTVTVRDGVAIVPVLGPIFRYANLFTEMSGATSLEVLATDLQRAVDDSTVQGIVLEVDSPGGQGNGLAELATAIRAAAAMKPVVAYAGGTAASAAYWLAAAAGEFVISETALVGSIGTVFMVDTRTQKDVLEIVSAQSPKKRPDPNAPDGRAEFQRIADEHAQIFVEHVARYRDVSVETVLAEFGQGWVLTGAKAVAAGMADRLGSLESVITGMAGTPKRSFTMAEKTPSPAMTRDQLAADHPALVESIRKDGYDAGHSAGLTEGRTAGATAERERIAAVRAQLIPGHEALIETLAADGKTTGPEAAVQVLAAEKAGRAGVRKDRQTDAAALADKAPAAPSAAGAPAADQQLAGLPVEERCKATWEKDAAIRAEFGTLEAYTAYEKACAAGQAKRLGAKTT